MKSLQYPLLSVEAIQASDLNKTIAIASLAAINSERFAVENTEASRRPLGEVIPSMICARLSAAAWSSLNIADEIGVEFDPVEFGKAAEALARSNQLHYEQKYRKPAGALQ